MAEGKKGFERTSSIKEMLMKKIVIYLVLLLGMVSAVPAFSNEPGATAEILPDLTLTVPENDSYIKYLGLTGKNGREFCSNRYSGRYSAY